MFFAHLICQIFFYPGTEGFEPIWSSRFDGDTFKHTNRQEKIYLDICTCGSANTERDKRKYILIYVPVVLRMKGLSSDCMCEEKQIHQLFVLHSQLEGFLIEKIRGASIVSRDPFQQTFCSLLANFFFSLLGNFLSLLANLSYSFSKLLVVFQQTCRILLANILQSLSKLLVVFQQTFSDLYQTFSKLLGVLLQTSRDLSANFQGSFRFRNLLL